MSGHDNLWVGNLMPGLRKTIEQIVCDYELYAINKNCLFDIIPQNVLSFSWPMHQVSPQQPTFLMPGIIRIIVSVQYPHSYRLFFSAAGMAALFFPRGGLEEGETLKHKQASGCPGLCRRNVGNIVAWIHIKHGSSTVVWTVTKPENTPLAGFC